MDRCIGQKFLRFTRYNCMRKKIILFSLQTFSTTGGIQKMTRTLAHALHLISLRNSWDFSLWSLYDSDNDLMPQYLPADEFKGFKVNRLNFLLKTILSSGKPDTIILSHINMAIVGLLIKTIRPKCNVWLIAHGIEVWRPLSLFKRILLNRCDKIICVSNYTKQQMIARHNVDPSLCTVLNNAVDSFMVLPITFEKPEQLLKRYRLTAANPVIFTLTRLASNRTV